jgi:hypothetical protein
VVLGSFNRCLEMGGHRIHTTCDEPLLDSCVKKVEW